MMNMKHIALEIGRQSETEKKKPAVMQSYCNNNSAATMAMAIAKPKKKAIALMTKRS